MIVLYSISFKTLKRVASLFIITEMGKAACGKINYHIVCSAHDLQKKISTRITSDSQCFFVFL